MKLQLALILSLAAGCATAPPVDPVPVHVRLLGGPSDFAHTSNRTGFLLNLRRDEIERRLRRRLKQRSDLVLVGPEAARYDMLLTLDESFGPEFIDTGDLFPGTQGYWVRVKVGGLIVERGESARAAGVERLEGEEKLLYETHGYALPRRESRVFERAFDKATQKIFDEFAARLQKDEATAESR